MHSELINRASAVLKLNDLGGWTRPAPNLYPHQWLWDSCFAAIGLAHIDPERAAVELLSLGRGQWSNGMLPHMIFSRRWPYRFESLIWGTGRQSPRGVSTSGITQPPMLAIAAERVAQALAPTARHEFIRTILPVLLASHQWIYRERDPHDTGLAAAVHSWESGMDDTPYWTEPMDSLPPLPWRMRWLREFRIVNPSERATPKDLQNMITLAYQCKQQHYDSQSIIEQSHVALSDLVFNSVLAAANESLERLAESVGEPLPAELRQHFAPTRQALEQLWDDQAGQYFSQHYLTGQPVRSPSAATFMPLFAGTASYAHADRLRRLMFESGGFSVPYPLPSVPTTSPAFEPQRYWRGPVWINLNWFAIVGLERYGFTTEAQQLRRHTLGLVKKSGFREYYNPMTGAGLGAKNFTWSAALALDLCAREPLS